MRRIIILTIALIAITISLTAQVQRDASGDFFAKSKSVAAHDSTTTFTYTDYKGYKYPVYQGRKGGYYVWVTSKSGNDYRKYLKQD